MHREYVFPHTPTRCITVEALQAALKKCRFFDSYGRKNVIQKEGSFDCKDNQETCDLFYPFIEKCLLYIREACLEEWDKGDRDSGMLTMNRGIQAVIGKPSIVSALCRISYS